MIGQAQDLLELDDPREANTNFHALVEEWKSIGYCGETNDDLWNQLHEVGQTIKENVRLFYEARDASAAAKRALISELVGQLASAKGADRLRLVKDTEKRWSALGHAGRSEKPLKTELNGITQPVRSEAKMIFEKRQRASETKADLIHTLSRRSSSGYKFSSSERADAIKKWKSIGHAGQDEENLWKQFLEALGG